MVSLQLMAAAVVMDVCSLAALNALESLQLPSSPLWGAEGTPWENTEHMRLHYCSRGG